MRTHRLLAPVLALSLAGCGLESLFSNIGHVQLDRPASKIVGTLALPTGAVVSILDPDGKPLTPFLQTVNADGTFELRLPSNTYSNLTLTSVSGNATLLGLIPFIGPESSVTVNLDARTTTEALITLARLSADASKWKKVTPTVYLGTRTLIQAAFDTAGPTQDLLGYVTRLITPVTTGGGWDGSLTGDSNFFLTPVFTADYAVVTSALDGTWLQRVLFDYVGDGRRRNNSLDFDTKLAAVAKLYQPAGCPDPSNVRIMFTVDFNSGRASGNCTTQNRFTWAVDKPGKSMFFVGWVHKDSPIQDDLVNARLGAGVPNQLPMHDDGQGGDEVASDNIWTIYFDVPRGVRIGYKYTWGFQGALWSGSEEWPGNSRIIEADDLNGDGFVYRRDVFGDEATNKDRSNANSSGTGSLDWTTVLPNRSGFGIEAREQPVDSNQDCRPDGWFTPQSVGPLTLSCAP